MRHIIIPAAFAAIVMGAVLPAQASKNERVTPITDQLVLKECGACHMAFQPAFLPAESWRTMMGNLSSHFGEDASLSAQDAQYISDFYVARSEPGGGADTLRITELSWWTREHRPSHVSQAMWDKAGAKMNCVACHRDAARGLYDDD